MTVQTLWEDPLCWQVLQEIQFTSTQNKLIEHLPNHIPHRYSPLKNLSWFLEHYNLWKNLKTQYLRWMTLSSSVARGSLCIELWDRERPSKLTSKKQKWPSVSCGVPWKHFKVAISINSINKCCNCSNCIISQSSKVQPQIVFVTLTSAQLQGVFLIGGWLQSKWRHNKDFQQRQCPIK